MTRPGSTRHSKISLVALLVLWYIVWGVCPWNNASAAAQPYYTAHTSHGHAAGHPAEESHHASKGSEHSCTGSAAYSSPEKLSQQCAMVAQTGFLSLAALHDVDTGLFRATRPSRPFFFQASVLPKRFADLSLFYSVFLI